MENLSSSSEQRLYRPRAGELVARQIEILGADPEFELSDEEMQSVVFFENSLMEGKYVSIDGDVYRASDKEEDLSEILDNTAYSQQHWELTTGYFMTEEGRQELMALGYTHDQGFEQAAINDFLRKKTLDISAEKAKELEKKSDEYAENLLVEALVEGREIDQPERIIVFTGYEEIIKRAEGFSAFHRFYRAVGRDLRKAVPSPTVMAKQAVLGMYRKRVNHTLAIAEPDLLALWEQSECLEEPAKSELKARIHTVWPNAGFIKTAEANQRFILRLDRLRNGSSLRDGRFTAISEALDELFVAEKEMVNQPETLHPRFTADEIAVLDTIKFDADQMQAFCKKLLGGLGKLSSRPETDYSPDRPTRAADGKWQVVVREDTRSMGADDPPGAFSIPTKFKRTITKLEPPVGPAPGFIHEARHIYQWDNVRNNSSGLRLGKDMKGKGATVMFEAGAILGERSLQQELFGRLRDDYPYYKDALKVLEQGQGEYAAIRAAFESQLRLQPDVPKKQAAEESIRRVKRLARRKGGFDSQALNYAESSLIAAASKHLDQRTKDILFAEGAYSLEDMAELHRFGLLNSKPEPFPTNDIIDMVEQELRQIMQTTVATP